MPAPFPAANQEALDAVLKQLYRDPNYGEATYKTAPLVGLLPKFTSFVGKSMPIPIRWATPAGVSNSFDKAKANAYSSRFSAFQLTQSRIYGTAEIDGLTADASDTDAGSFIKAFTSEIDGVMESVTQKLETDLFRSGTGSLGTVLSGQATNTITLGNINDVVNFEVGMTVVASAAPDTFPIAANRVGTVIIAKVDRNAGTLTSQGASWVAGIGAIVPTDVLMREGDLNAAFTGLQAWMPAVVTPTLFYGVDRTDDVVRLGGNRYDASTTGELIEESLIEGQGRAAREGGRPDTIFMNNLDFRRLVKSVGSKVMYPRDSTRKAIGEKGLSGDISFQTLRLQGDYGPMDVLSSPKCPQGKAFVLQMDTWSLNSLGTVPKILMRDGLRIQRHPDKDAYVVRVGGYGNLGCNHPGANCLVTLPSN